MGPAVVEGLHKVAGENVRILSLPQLDVTLAPEMRDTDVVVFVDARVDDSDERVKVGQIKPATGPIGPYHTSHTISMSFLLRIARDWYGASPACYTVLPKGYEFPVGEVISQQGQLAGAQARERVLKILRSHS